ncbi:MAG: N-formylglutamate amidohydrolase, partial [Nitrospinales bacterium]
LIQKYHTPYHKNIQELMDSNAGIKLALDCHSMESIGPSISPDPGKERPPLCLSNNNGKSCPDEWIQKLAECFQKSFGFKDGEVKINDPFSGGYITRKYGNNPIPWIQIEMNRSLYLSTPWFDEETLLVDPNRLEMLKTAFREGLYYFRS